MSITFLLVSILLTLILLWISSMILWWQEENEHAQETVDEHFSRETNRLARYGRRSYYGLVLYTKKLTNWGTVKTKKILAVHFPNVHKTITKPDPLTGLTHGPASYFLHSLSEKDKKK